MIQRIQSVYLLIAAICNMVCLSMPIGRFASDGLLSATMYNLWILPADGSRLFISAPLFVVLLFATAISLYTIFMYKNRKRQMLFCTFSTLIIVGWYVYYALLALALYGSDNGNASTVTFAPAICGALPAVALILNIMARFAIKADERLVRAADRIR